MIVIVTNKRKHAEYYARIEGIPRRELRIVTRLDEARGLRVEEYLYDCRGDADYREMEGVIHAAHYLEESGAEAKWVDLYGYTPAHEEEAPDDYQDPTEPLSARWYS